MKITRILMLVLVLMVTSISQATLDDGLVAYYPFNGNANDASGNGHNGTVNGASLVSDRSGTPDAAYSFNGSSFISIPDADAFTFGSDSFTIATWMQFSSLGSYYMMGHDEGAGERNKWIFWPHSSGVIFHVNSPSGAGFLPISYNDWNPTVDTWYHLAVTRDGNNYSIYIDGQEVATSTDARSIPNPNAPLLLGDAEGQHPERNFRGLMDDVRLYSRALSESEIQELYVPEPTSLLLLGLGALMLRKKRTN